jgi:hypothetical protein
MTRIDDFGAVAVPVMVRAAPMPARRAPRATREPQ